MLILKNNKTSYSSDLVTRRKTKETTKHNQNMPKSSIKKQLNSQYLNSSLLKSYFIPFTSKVKKEILGKLPEGIADKVDKFEETHDKNIATHLGGGLFANVYRFNNTPYVIKESYQDKASLEVNDKFNNEAIYLNKLSDTTNTQNLVSQVMTENNNYYLVSTAVEGASSDPIENPLKPDHLKSILKVLQKLDKLEVYHNDLNSGNCLITPEGKANIIDYQFAQNINPAMTSYNDSELNTPSFMIPSNIQMYEMSNLPFYLMKLEPNKAKDLFNVYLKVKANFHKNKAGWIQHKYGSAYNEAIEYEQLRGHFLGKPSEEITKLQALRLQTLYGFRQAFTAVDPNNPEETNIMKAPLLFLGAAAAAKKFVDYAKELKSNPPKNINQREKEHFNKFIAYEVKFGNYWKNKMLKSGEGTFNWMFRNATGNTWSSSDDVSSRILAFNDVKLSQLADVAKLINNEPPINLNKSYHYVNDSIKNGFYEVAKKINSASSYKKPQSAKFEKDLKKLNALKGKFERSFMDSFNSLNNGKLLASTIPPLKTIFYARLMKEQGSKLYTKSDEPEVYQYANTYKELGDYVIKEFPETTSSIFKRVKDTIDDNNYLLDYQLNQTDLYEFDVKMPNQFIVGSTLKFKDD